MSLPSQGGPRDTMTSELIYRVHNFNWASHLSVTGGTWNAYSSCRSQTISQMRGPQLPSVRLEPARRARTGSRMTNPADAQRPAGPDPHEDAAQFSREALLSKIDEVLGHASYRIGYYAPDDPEPVRSGPLARQEDGSAVARRSHRHLVVYGIRQAKA